MTIAQLQPEAKAMKKIGILLLFILFSVIFSGTAVALPTPFQVGTGGYLDETVTDGLGLIAKQEALPSGPIWLDTQETSETIDFFKIWVPLAAAAGTVDAYIEFLQPEPDDDVVSTGAFKIFSFLIFSKGELKWEEPELMPYSYDGSTGGLLQVDLIDIPKEWQKGTCYTISGTITNVRSVPEPGTIFLLGFGLAGLAGYSHRKFRK
jgi:hypothetical protein